MAAAHSIYACGRMHLPPSSVQLLLPQLLTNDEISLGGIVYFKKEQFCRLIESGFAIPRIGKIFISPLKTFRVFAALFKVGRLYNSQNTNVSAPILLRGSLEAICIYMNYHEEASKIFEPESKNSLEIKILETFTNFLIDHKQNVGWSVAMGPNTDTSSAKLSFKNTEIAHQAAIGSLDSWIAITNGDIQLAGRIPMLDKFGYVARIAQYEVPSPK